MFEAIADSPAVFAECPVWLPGPELVCWIDCAAGKVFALDWRTHQVSVLVSMPGTLLWGLVKRDRDSLLLLATSGAYAVDLHGYVFEMALPRPVDPVLGNDAKVDRHGRLWLGQVRSAPDRSDGSLMWLARGHARRAVAGLGIPNGPAFSQDGAILYAVDSLAGLVTSFALDEEGAVASPRVILSAAGNDGQPDGLTVDSAGRILVAMFGGGGLVRADPAHLAVERLAVPASQPTSCTFGGPDLRTLFVTVARGGWPHDRSNPGIATADPALPSLYALEMPVAGLPEPDLAETVFGQETMAL